MSAFQQESHKAAYQAALRTLAARPRTVEEIRRRLLPRFDEAVVTPLLEKLQEQGLLDDAAFAAAWRENREQLHPRSAILVRQELLRHGVDPATVDNAVADMDDDDAALRAALKYVSRVARLDVKHRNHRMGAYLMRRGFGADVVWRALRQLYGEVYSDDEPSTPPSTVLSV